MAFLFHVYSYIFMQHTHTHTIYNYYKHFRKSKLHMPLNKSEHQITVENVLAEAWHNMHNPLDIKTEAWEGIHLTNIYVPV